MTEGDKKEVTSCSVGNHLTPNPDRYVSLPAHSSFQPPVKRKYNCLHSKQESTSTLAPLPLPPKLIHPGGTEEVTKSERQRLQWAPPKLPFIRHPVVTNAIQSHFPGQFRELSHVNVALPFPFSFVSPLTKTTTGSFPTNFSDRICGFKLKKNKDFWNNDEVVYTSL